MRSPTCEPNRKDILLSTGRRLSYAIGEKSMGREWEGKDGESNHNSNQACILPVDFLVANFDNVTGILSIALNAVKRAAGCLARLLISISATDS